LYIRKTKYEKKLPLSEGKIRKKTRKDAPPSIKRYFSIFHKKNCPTKARRLKKYQRRTWKTKYFKNKNIFSKKMPPPVGSGIFEYFSLKKCILI
jgi:predicted GIY-YIG superfamily endonuclease